MSRREPGERYFAALDRSREEKVQATAEAERLYTRDVAVVCVITLLPPLLFCTAMIVGALSDDIAVFVMRFLLGPLGVIATAFMIGLIVKYERYPQRDGTIPLVIGIGAPMGAGACLMTNVFAYVLIPLSALVVLFPWERFGPGAVGGLRVGSRGQGGSRSA